MPARHSPFAYVALVAVLVLVWFWYGGFADGGPREDRDAMIGTWTDPAGPPGNSIRFYYVPRDIPGASYAKAYEGHITLMKFLGQEEAPAIWNYGSWDPLVLNLIVGNKAYFAAIQKVDDDHILIRFGSDPEEMYRPGAIDHPDTRRLVRTGREPGL